MHRYIFLLLFLLALLLINLVPPPATDDGAPLRALIFDSVYDSYKGVIVYVRIKEGVLKPATRYR